MNEGIAYLISSIATILTAFGTIASVVYNKRKEFELHQKAIKEENYAEFLGSLILVLNKKRNGQEYDDELNALMKSIELIYIIGSPEVVNRMNVLLELANVETTDNESNDQDTLYANLVKKIRKDLGNSKNDKNFPDKLKMWTFH